MAPTKMGVATGHRIPHVDKNVGRNSFWNLKTLISLTCMVHNILTHVGIGYKKNPWETQVTFERVRQDELRH